MKRLILSLLLLIAIIFSCDEKQHLKTGNTTPAKSTETATTSNGSAYEKLWREVTEKLDKGLPKSALKVIDTIYAKAKKEENSPQTIKALIHKIYYLQRVEEETLVKIQTILQKEVKTSKHPVTPLLHSMIAEQYWNYFTRNRHRFYNRTATKQFKQNDMRTWDRRKIVETIFYHYKKSLENAELSQKTKIDIYEEVLYNNYKNKKKGRDYRPTLYDFLAHRAIDFFMNSEAGLTKPVYQFDLNNKDFLSHNKTFSRLRLRTKDTMSFSFYALKYLQELVRFHQQTQNINALIDADLKRLRFVYKNAVIDGKNSMYESTLRSMAKTYRHSSAVSEVNYELANLYYTMSSSYVPEKNEQHKWYRKKARELCIATIKKYPESYGAAWCLRLKNDIESKNLSIKLEIVTIPGKPFRGYVDYRNISKLYFRIVKTTQKEYVRIRYKYNTSETAEYYAKKQPLRTWSTSLPDDGDFQNHATEITAPELSPGKYIMLSSNSNTFDQEKYAVTMAPFDVSGITYIQKKMGRKGLELHVLDRDSGKALANARVRIWYREWNNKEKTYEYNKGKLLKVDKNGYLNINQKTSRRNYFHLEFINGNDRLFLNTNFYIYSHYTPQFTKKERTYFFTDRSIYRPGQTVYFKGIKLYQDTKDGEKCRLLPDRSATVTLHDVNGQKVRTLKLTTNKYGTFSGSFTLPRGLLNGNMTIREDSRGSVGFSVEEYKRPKFSVSFDQMKKSYKLNDMVPVTGKAEAFAGYNVDNAQVKYRVVRSVYYPYSWYFWGYYPQSSDMEIKNGTTKTDAAGAFTVTFKAVPDKTVSPEHRPAFRYTVYADITDLNGETRSSQQTVTIGYTALVLSSQNQAQVDRDRKKYTFSINSTNLSGDFLPAKGAVTIHKLASPKTAYRSRLWGQADRFTIKKPEYRKQFPNDIYKDEQSHYNWKKTRRVYKSGFNTAKNRKVLLNNIHTWETGKYIIEMEGKDRFGNTIMNKSYFTLYSANGKQVPFKQLDWFAVPKTTVEPGENAVVLLGSSAKNVRVMYEIEYRGQVISKKFISINRQQKKIVIPVKEKHRGGIGVSFTFIKHNRHFKHQLNFNVPWSNKALDISFETFRNKLTPGEKEEWRIKIKGKKQDKIAAEMAATLYDASLDTFRSHWWGFSVFPSHYMRSNWYGDNSIRALGSSLVGHTRESSRTKYRDYDHLNWFGFYWTYYGGLRRYKSKGLTMNGNGRDRSDSFVYEELDIVSDDEKAAPMSSSKKERLSMEKTFQHKEIKTAEQQTVKKDVTAVKARKNFNETAFFYPHLKTNKNGEILISFTVPEALTKWRMMGFAHTKDLKSGFVYNNLVTQKQLMVVPNAPRFLRENDTLEFSSKITNMSDKDQSGTVALMLFDAATMKPVDSSFEHTRIQKTFKALKGRSTLVTWQIRVPENVEAVTYRVVARAGTFSDGEEKPLPILKNRMLVTESMPLPVRSLQTKTFTFNKLINSGKSTTLRHHKLTLEFTSNPAWYAVQALPYIMEYPYECMEQTFSRYYANAIAAHIVKKTPKIKQVFNKWKNTKGGSALLSNLHKNQELKAVMLEETPWVLQASNESERKKRIALLFDLHRMSDELDRALRKLSQGQMSSGAWPWFRGMHENRYMTQHLMSGFAHLHALGAIDAQKDPKVWKMVSKAIPYLDRQIQRDYDYLLKNKINLKQNNLGYIQIHYLYARSYFQQIPVASQHKKAFNYYKEQAREYWLRFNKYSQGMIALALHRYRDTKTAKKILASIKEHSLYSEEMGMYWKGNYGYYWYQMPIETQALLIEAFSEITNDEKAVDDMKTWLIKSKQTQDWRTTKATADACYALLLKGDQWLEENKLADITMGSIKIDPYKNKDTGPEAGTGYFKTSWSGTEIKPSMGKVTVKNNNKVVAWGALYWQYFEQLDKITPHKTPLQLQKKLFVEKPSDTGPVLIPVSKSKLKIGDRIKVRIELRVDRSMEYVHMKDMRASGFEPENVISHYKWQDGLGYYESTKDAATNFFIDYLPKGTYVFEYPLRVTHKGDFSNGITTIQCMYAPEFTSHSEGIRVNIK